MSHKSAKFLVLWWVYSWYSSCACDDDDVKLCSFRQITDYSLVQFQPLDVTEEGSMDDVLLYINNAIQYGEDLDVRMPAVSAQAVGS